MDLTLNCYIVILGIIFPLVLSEQDIGYNCSFSKDLCGWTQDLISDDFDWTRHHGRTSSSDTGPVRDHTSQLCTTCPGYYMYIEVSSPRQVSDKARLKGPVFNVSPGEYKCFSFWFHMYGDGIGKLNVYIVKPNSTTYEYLWKREHDQGDVWLTDNITIPEGNHLQIMIEGIVASYQGDIAIDDTKLTEGSCTGVNSIYNTNHGSTPTLNTTAYPWWLTSRLFSASSRKIANTTTITAAGTTTTAAKTTTATDNGFHGAVHVACTKYSWSIKIDMDRLRHEYSNVKTSDIYLGENRCTGVEKQNILEFNYGLSECLTTDMLMNGVHVYNNELIYAEHDPVYLYIIRHFNWTLGVQCQLQADGTVNGAVQTLVTHQASVLNSTQYPVNISYFSDPNFAHQVSGHPLQEPPGSQVYVKVFTTISDWNTKMRLHTCYTSPSQHVLDHLKYYLIKDGCEVDVNTHIMSQSTHETVFVFDNFEYTNYPQGGIYVFCDATFCASSDYSSSCKQACNPIVNG